MAWIESHETLGEHPKLFVLVEELGIDEAAAVGHLHYLWWWCIKYAPDGTLARYSETQLARAAKWKKTPTDFINAMLKAGFLDRNPEGPGLAIHDWLDFCGQVIDKRLQRAAAKRPPMAAERQPNGIGAFGPQEKESSKEKEVQEYDLSSTSTSYSSYLIPEPKESPEDALIMRYKVLKGVPHEHTGWDRKWWQAYRPLAKQLLKDCVTYAKAYACLEHWATVFQKRGYKDWTLRAVADRAIEWMGTEGEKIHGPSNSERFFAALRKQRSVEEGDPGLRKLAGAGAILGPLRDPETPAHGRGGTEESKSSNGHERTLDRVQRTPVEGTADRGKKA